MGYVLGISSGLFSVGKDESIYGLWKKGYYSITHGVRFTQIDVERITEFKDPFLKERIEELKRFGVEFGFHGETRATSGAEVIGFDVAIADIYKISHERLLAQIKFAGELGAKYLLFHASESLPFQMLFRDLQPSKLVDFWGRPLRELVESEKFLERFVFESNEKIKEILWGFERAYHISTLDKYKEYKEKLKKELEKAKREYEKETDETRKRVILETIRGLERDLERLDDEIQRLREECLKIIDSYDLHYGPERFAYYVVAKYMQETKDPIWYGIVGKKLSDKELVEKPELWVSAVATKYIWGHINPKLSEYENPKPLLEKHKLYLVWETGFLQTGMEGMMRIATPKELYTLAKHLGTPYAGWCLDMEHILSVCNIDIENEIRKLPRDAGTWLKVVHVAYPSPLHAHMPISLGSEAHEFLYKILYILRQKGFREGWIIYERGDKPAFQTIEVLRRIKEFLEKDVPPEELPPEFYGFKIDEPEVIRQREVILQHAMDPIKGLIAVPEEEHTFLSRTALERGKAEQWKREEMR